ncbi:MAG: methyltransferase domain-containing protein [Planctomycetes bacterium]|nr:methyltransferase domain-containing protein [Planctomycetota bacterium]
MPDSEPRRATLTSDYQRDWPKYFDAVSSSPPRDTCLRALAALTQQGNAPIASQTRKLHAIDIACGEGRDTRAILAADPRWHVFATDSSHEGLQRLSRSLSAADAARVTLTQATMEELSALVPTPHSADLINASFALPFCHPDHFPRLWKWIGETLIPGGVFAGQLFGDRDEWASVRPQSHFSRRQVLGLLDGYEIVFLDEVEKDGDDAMGGLKHHHVFHVVVRKL